MKKWFIPKLLLDDLNSQLVFENNYYKKGYIQLQDTNSYKKVRFLHPIPAKNEYGWIAERKTCPEYYRQIILEIKLNK